MGGLLQGFAKDAVCDVKSKANRLTSAKLRSNILTVAITAGELCSQVFDLSPEIARA
jgi:hypothetical protein